MRILGACVLTALSILQVCCEQKTPVAHETLTVHLDNTTGGDKGRAQHARMREFLWNHWVRSRPASLSLTTVSKEGEYDLFAIRNHLDHAQELNA
jgi:hypothetical protein